MTPRRWIWTSLAVQAVGFVLDVAGHAFRRPGWEPATVGEMATHLLTVHLVLYLGVLGLLVSTAWALVDQVRRSGPGLAMPIAFAGAVVQTGGEIWHVYTHLQLRPGGLVETVAILGAMVVVVGLLAERRARRRAA
jgi:hypothetical protein